jgi:hypothetical protein
MEAPLGMAKSEAVTRNNPITATELITAFIGSPPSSLLPTRVGNPVLPQIGLHA